MGERSIEQLAAYVSGLSDHDRGNLYALAEMGPDRLESLLTGARAAGKAAAVEMLETAQIIGRLFRLSALIAGPLASTPDAGG